MAKLKNTSIKKIDDASILQVTDENNSFILDVDKDTNKNNYVKINGNLNQAGGKVNIGGSDGMTLSIDDSSTNITGKTVVNGEFEQTGNASIGPNDNLKITADKNKISLTGETEITGKLVQTGNVKLGGEKCNINISESEGTENSKNSIKITGDMISLNNNKNDSGGILLTDEKIEINSALESETETTNAVVKISGTNLSLENKSTLTNPDEADPNVYYIDSNKLLLEKDHIKLGRVYNVPTSSFLNLPPITKSLAYLDIENSYLYKSEDIKFLGTSTVNIFAGDNIDKSGNYSEIKLGIEKDKNIGINITNKNGNESSLALNNGEITIKGKLSSSSDIETSTSVLTNSIKPYDGGDICIGGEKLDEAYININIKTEQTNTEHKKSVDIYDGVYVDADVISFKKPIDSFRFQDDINFYKESKEATYLTKTVFNKFQSLNYTDPDASDRKMFEINKFSKDTTENIKVGNTYYETFAVIPFSEKSFSKHNCISVADFYNNFNASYKLINKIKITVSNTESHINVFLGYQSSSGSEAFYKLTLPQNENFFNLIIKDGTCSFYANSTDKTIRCEAINAIYLCYDIDGFLNNPVSSSTADNYSENSIITLSYDILKNNNKVAVDDNSVAIGTDVNNTHSIFIGTRKDSSNASSDYATNYGLLSDIAIGKNIDTSKVVMSKSDSASNASEQEYNRVIIGNGAGVTGSGGVAIGHGAKIGKGTNINAGDQTGADYLYLGVGGEIWATATTSSGGLSTTSDYRDKTDFKPIESALSFINSLEPLTFRVNPRYKYYKDGEFQEDDYKAGKQAGHRRLAGFKAQDVYQKMIDVYHDDNYAQIVDYSKYDNPEDTNDIYSMYTASLVPFLTRAIQEQEEIINKLEERILALEKQLEINKEKE